MVGEDAGSGRLGMRKQSITVSQGRQLSQGDDLASRSEVCKFGWRVVSLGVRQRSSDLVRFVWGIIRGGFRLLGWLLLHV